VGTRKATSNGINFCQELIEALAPMDPVIVSGFAYGIDITAHKAAIQNNLQTVACMAHGLNQIYPKPHATFQMQMEHNGGFVSDFWSDIKFDRKNFLKRNRIIAGLSEATIVFESAEKGGSLVTADMANNYDREVFAVPGRPQDKRSIGCNNLIKKQQAHLLSCPADLVYMLNWDIEKKNKRPQQQRLFIELNDEEQKIVDSLEKLGKTELDDIALETKLPTYKIAGLLLNLELNGLIRPLPGNQYELIG
jgi:DNA processing protein